MKKSCTALVFFTLWAEIVRSAVVGVKSSPRSTIKATTIEQASLFGNLRLAARECVRESYRQFAKDNIGRDKEGSWVVQSKLAVVLNVMEDLKLRENHDVFKMIADAPWPIWLNITDSFEGRQSTEFEFSLFSIPAGQCLQPRRHPAGTIVLFKKLLGSCQMRTLIGEKMREINKLELQDNVLIRLAGTTKVFESLEGATAAVMELAIFPPRRVDEGFGTDSGFSSESKQCTCRMDIDTAAANIMFESAAAALLIKNRELEEAERVAVQGGVDLSEEVLVKMRSSVGGLGNELQALARRILISRQLPAEVFRDLGLTHVKGLLLYGPPGCGKTLIARELSRALNSRDPIVVNGPEILSKYIGEAESNLRNLFREAEEEWKLKGRASSLHIVIFDEFDAIGRTRGTSRDASGVRDSCVNQLLTLLDGTRQMSNVLVIALTNRKDMLDPALLRPGRLEVHLEIGLPTTEGRRDILRILFAPLLVADYVTEADSAAWIDRIVQRSDGANGADLAGIMRNAASHTILRWQREHYSRAVRDSSVPVPISQSLTGSSRTQAAQSDKLSAGGSQSQSWSKGTRSLSESSLKTLQARCEWIDFEKALDTYKERD